MRGYVYIAALLAIAPLAGCGRQESREGGPGAVSEDRTFTLSLPSGDTNVARGKREEVTIKINRGEGFDQRVKLEFAPAAGVTIIPADAAIQRGESEVKVFVNVTADASSGRKPIKVTATPETGKAVSLTMNVDVP